VAHVLYAADGLIAAGEQHAECEAALNLFLRRRPAIVRPVDGLAWLEIDFPADVERATREVLPLVRAREAMFRAAPGDTA
jgi:choline kinase